MTPTFQSWQAYRAHLILMGWPVSLTAPEWQTLYREYCHQVSAIVE